MKFKWLLLNSAFQLNRKAGEQSQRNFAVPADVCIIRRRFACSSNFFSQFVCLDWNVLFRFRDFYRYLKCALATLYDDVRRWISIWTIAGIVCCDAISSSFLHNNTKNVFMHRTIQAVLVTYTSASGPMHVRKPSNVIRITRFGRTWLDVAAHMLTTILASVAPSLSVQWHRTHWQEHTRTAQPLTRLRMCWTKQKVKQKTSISIHARCRNSSQRFSVPLFWIFGGCARITYIYRRCENGLAVDGSSRRWVSN